MAGMNVWVGMGVCMCMGRMLYGKGMGWVWVNGLWVWTVIEWIRDVMWVRVQVRVCVAVGWSTEQTIEQTTAQD